MPALTRSDVETVEGKLHEFSQDLPEKERQAIGWLVARARNAPDAGEMAEDVEAPAADDGLASTLGFAEGVDTLTITWRLSF